MKPWLLALALMLLSWLAVCAVAWGDVRPEMVREDRVDSLDVVHYYCIIADNQASRRGPIYTVHHISTKYLFRCEYPHGHEIVDFRENCGEVLRDHRGPYLTWHSGGTHYRVRFKHWRAIHGTEDIEQDELGYWPYEQRRGLFGEPPMSWWADWEGGG